MTALENSWMTRFVTSACLPEVRPPGRAPEHVSPPDGREPICQGAAVRWPFLPNCEPSQPER